MARKSFRLYRGLAALFIASVLILPATTQAADTKLKFAFNKTIDQLPIFMADKKGYLRAEGIELEYLTLNTGPAVGSAVAGGAADFGYAATMPAIVARAEGQPFKLFAALDFETAPTDYPVVMLASGRSGIEKLSEVKGKTLALNTAGGQCELMARVQLKLANIPYDAVTIVSIPFPQMQAALQLGTVDAACAFDPFRTAILQSPLKAKTIAGGLILDPTFKGRYLNTGLFAREDWIAQHGPQLEALMRALARAVVAIRDNEGEARQLLVEQMNLPEAVAKAVRISLGNGLEVRPQDLQPVIDSAVAVGMVKKPLDARDMVLTIAGK